MAQPPGFFETFNPQSIVPLALKKFDLDMKKRQLDMMEKEHGLKVEGAARDLAAKKEWENFMKGKETTTYTGVEPVGITEPGIEKTLEPPSPQEIYKKALEIATPEVALKTLAPKPEEFGATSWGTFSKGSGEPKFQKPISPVSTLSDTGKLSAEREQLTREILNESATAEGPNQNKVRRLQEINAEIDKKTSTKEPTESLTEPALTLRALRGDKEAQAVLDAMQKRKLHLAEATLDVRGKDIDIPALADAVANDQMAGLQVRGSMGNPVLAKVQSEVKKKYPSFNFQMNDANYKWKSSQTNQRTINFVGGALPRVNALVTQLNALPNVDLNVINRVMRIVSKETGKPEYTDFESNRNAIIQEINTALSGSATQSDMRIKIEMENLNAARAPRQILGALNNLNEALIARMDIDLSPIYPIEVVQGKKTVEQYKDELFRKYRGKFDAPGLAKVQGARSFGEQLPTTTQPKKIGRFTVEVED